MSTYYQQFPSYDPRILTPLEWENPILCTTCHERAVYEGMDECLRCFCIGAEDGELLSNLDLYAIDLDPENGWNEEPDIRYIAEQEPGQPVRRLDR